MKRLPGSSPRRSAFRPAFPKPSCIWEWSVGNSASLTMRNSYWRMPFRLLPQSAPAHYYLGLVLEDQSRRAEAIREVEAAVKLQPDWTEAQTRLGSCCSARATSTARSTHCAA